MIPTTLYSKKPKHIVLWLDISGLKMSGVSNCSIPKTQALGSWHIKYKQNGREKTNI